MAERIPVNPGRVEWSGDNPGIYLKESPEGDWTRLASFFRIALSPHGRGQAMVVLGAPDQAAGYPEAPNLCLADNRPLMDYLLDGFLSRFPTFRGRPGLEAMAILPLQSAETLGDFESAYSEVAKGAEVSLRMTWRRIGKPFAVEVAPDQCATGAHDMYSLFMEAGDAEIAINDVPLSGQVVSRPFFGTTMSTAFLAFSETWVAPPGVP